MRLSDLVAAAVDLVLPTECAGCGEPSALRGVCASCVAVWRIAPHEARPVPAPEGLPLCLSAADYGGLARSLILAYKDGRRGLAGMLGDALAETVAAGVGRPALGWPLVLVPVPATAAAIRARHGDHMLRLARRAADRLRRGGWRVRVMRPLRARRKLDAGHLDRQERAWAARDAFVLRGGQATPLRQTAVDAVVVVLDDVLTTGATLAAVSRRLHAAGAPVAFAATVAATRLRGSNH
jgi:predicted amidophosphoribosyltransferase